MAHCLWRPCKIAYVGDESRDAVHLAQRVVNKTKVRAQGDELATVKLS